MGHIILGDYRYQQSRKSATMFSLLLLLPGLLTAATLTKHLKAPSPIYTPPVYSEYNGHGHGLSYGHGHNNVAYNQGFANGGYVTGQARPCVHRIPFLFSGISRRPPPSSPGQSPCWPVHRQPPALRQCRATAALPPHPVPRLALPWPWTQDCQQVRVNSREY